jgi:tetratricopeptide (TPR) repeat protein
VRDLAVLSERGGGFGFNLNGSDEEWVFPALAAVIEAEPDNPDYRALRATAYNWKSIYVSSKPEDRLADYQNEFADRDAQVRLARNDRERAQALYGRGQVNRRLKKKDAAVADVSEAIKLDPQADYYELRAIYYGNEETYFVNETPPDLAAAIEDISAAIELEPDHDRYGLRAKYYAKQGQVDAALADLDSAMALSKDNSHQYTPHLAARAELLRESGRLDAALNDYAELNKKDPKQVKWRLGQLLVFMAQGNDRQVAGLRKRIEASDPKALTGKTFLCAAAAIEAGGAAGSDGRDPGPSGLRNAFGIGEVIGLLPLLRLAGDDSEQSQQAWDRVSELVRKSRGQPLEEIPTLEGSKSAQLRQMMAFILRQREAVETMISNLVGAQAAAMFRLSVAGNMASALNRFGFPGANGLLANDIKADGARSGLACELWIDMAVTTADRDKAGEVAETWYKAREAIRAELSKS